MGKASPGPAMYVGFRWDSLDLDSPLPLRELQQGKLKSVIWQAQSSGTRIRGLAAIALERLWRRHYTSKTKRPPIVISLRTSDDAELSAVEAQRRKLFITHRRREHRLRDAKIREAMGNGSLRCEVDGCGFDFAKIYGDIGAGFAEVHHLLPLGATTRRPRRKTTLDDLAIVCANCHRMIHRGGECRSLVGLLAR